MSKAGPFIPSQTLFTLQQAFKVALSMALLYWLALWMDWDMPKYGGLAIALISLDTTGASMLKGILRMVGTTAGLAVGLLGLALFAQNEWMTLIYHATYLIFIGYFIQTSRYPYAWYVAGFLPSLVWSTTYGNIDNAFHYAIFRYLETSAGILIYTLVSINFWPRTAGEQLKGQGDELWCGFQNLFGMYCLQLKEGQLSPDAAASRAKLTGTMSKLRSTLLGAYTDTPAINHQKRDWESLRLNTRAMNDALELWRQSLDDCRRLDLNHFIPSFQVALVTIEQRLSRIKDLWQLRSTGTKVERSDADSSLLEIQSLATNREQVAALSHLDRAALLSFREQLKILDLTSRELLHTIQKLSGLSPTKDFKSHVLPTDLFRPARWNPVRLINGLLPATSFVAAFIFWIYFNPPSGPSVPNMAATFGLMTLLAPINAASLIMPVLIAMACFVAPVYFLIMPRLSTGTELLACIFSFTFATCALLVGRLALLRTFVLIFFVMMTGISNNQVYSFPGLVNGAFMSLLALGVIAIVQTLFNPLRPEQRLLKTVHQLCLGCARVLNEFQEEAPINRLKKRRVRKRIFESLIQPAPGKIQAAQKQLNYKLFPDNPPAKVQTLIDALQNISFRMQSLEMAQNRLTHHTEALPESFSVIDGQIQNFLQSEFESWQRFESRDELANRQNELTRLSEELEQRLDQLNLSQDQTYTDLYSLIGSLRSLIDAMASTQAAFAQINWSQWATVRF